MPTRLTPLAWQTRGSARYGVRNRSTFLKKILFFAFAVDLAAVVVNAAGTAGVLLPATAAAL